MATQAIGYGAAAWGIRLATRAAAAPLGAAGAGKDAYMIVPEVDGPPVSKGWGEGFCGDWKWCAGDIATEPELPADDSGLDARVAVEGLITGIMGVVSWLPLIICDWHGTRIICPGDCTLNGIWNGTSRVVFCTLLPFEVNSSLAVRLGKAPFIAFGTLTAGTDTVECGEDDVTAASGAGGAAGIGCTTFIELTSLESAACDWVEVGVL